MIVHRRYKTKLANIIEEDLSLFRYSEKNMALNSDVLKNNAETVLRTDEQLYNLM